jgi:methylthioribose-1-phosphate isomerase
VSMGEQRMEWTPKDSKAFNPSFDVTPVELVTGLVTDQRYFTRDELKKNALSNMK